MIEFKAKTFKEILESHPNSKKYPEVVKSRKVTSLSDSEKVIALIPIINSDKTKVTEATKNIFIDITGTEKNIVESASNIIASSFFDQKCGIFPCLIHYKKDIVSPVLGYKKIKIKYKNVNKLLGTEIDENRIISSLNRMGYIVEGEEKNPTILMPPYRTDILNEQDVIEDIAIGYGYSNILPKPISYTDMQIGSVDAITKTVENISINMVGFGFSEAINNYLTSKQTNFYNMEIKNPDETKIVSIMRSKTESLSMLRTSLLPSLLQNLNISSHETMPQKLFEIGGVFSANEKQSEDLNLGFVTEHSKANFIEIKGYTERLLSLLGYNYELKESSDPSFIEGRFAEIIMGGETIGRFGEISPKVLVNFKLEEPVAAAEIRIFKNVDY